MAARPGTAEIASAVDDALAQVALDRARVFLPFIILGLLLSLVASVPSGIPLPLGAIAANIVMISAAATVWLLLRRNRLPLRWAHAVGALTWLVAPITTLVSLLLVREPTLALPLMIELATASLQVDSTWALCSTTSAVAIGEALVIAYGSPPIYAVGVAGVWIVAMIMQIGLRRSMVHGETRRLEAKREIDVRAQAEADRDRLEEQFTRAQRMEAVGTLAAGVAHDMNNILGGILGFAQILRASTADPQVKEDLEQICREAERGAALTRSLLAFSRGGQYQRRPVRLEAVLDDLAPLIALTAGKGVKIDRRPGKASTIFGDPSQLGQAIINICMNAADAMSGDGTLRIETDQVELPAGAFPDIAEGRHARLSITDTGAGMDAATRARIFEPFFTTKPLGKGTGLGLTMVYSTVRAHAGAIEVVSDPGKGTTFHVYVPLSTGRVREKRLTDSERRRLRGLVLVVDDEPMVRTAATRAIEMIGLKAIAAGDGAEALELYQQRRDDVALIVLDMVMPKMAGRECFHALRKIGLAPVLLTSGYVEHAASEELLAAGARGFLQKPYTPDELGREIDRILNPAP